MKLSKTQTEALNKTPIFLGQSELNLNVMYWTDNKCTQDFRESTIQALINKGLLEYQTAFNGNEDRTEVKLTSKAIELGFKSTV
jgi:hypothetical protein